MRVVSELVSFAKGSILIAHQVQHGQQLGLRKLML
jgi:hypothetical protein